MTNASLSSYHEKATVALSFGQIRTRVGVDQFPSLPFDALTFCVVNCCMYEATKQSDHRKASYPRTQPRDQSAG